MKANYNKRRQWRSLFAVTCGIMVAWCGRTACAGETNEVFIKNCAVCHGQDGKAESSIAKKLGVKNLSQSNLTDTQIEQQIREGKLDDQEASKMPAFKDRLTDEEIRALVRIVKEFRKPPE